MIDFRYHIVSLAAVFLALAVGVVLGTTALSGPALEQVNQEARNLRSDKQDLRRALEDSRGRVRDADAFATAVTPTLVSGRLTGQRVALVRAPGAPEPMRDGLADTIRAAGGALTSDVALTAAYFDPAKADLLDDLVARLVQPGVALPTGAPTDRAAAVLAAALVRRPPPAAGAGPPGASPPPGPDPASAAVLAGFREAGFLTVEGTPTPATLAVVLVPAQPPAPEPTRARQSLAAAAQPDAVLALARALDARGAGAVLAGARGAASGDGALARLRNDQGMARAVSSVDVADTAGGRVAVVLGLAAELHGQAGQYGAGDGARTFLPGSGPRPPA